MDKADFLEAIESDSEALLSAASSVPLDTPIAAVGGWLMRELVAHQTFVWGFATANVLARGDKTGPSSPKPPEDESEIFDWAGAVRLEMLDVLSAADPATEVWSFAPNNQTAGFWQRRMFAETMVHRWDAQSAALAIDPLYPDRAAEAIDEYTEVGLRFSSGRPNRIYPSRSLHIHCADTEGEWTLVGDDGPNVTVTREHAKGDAAVRGQAEELLLWIWGRPGEVEIFGDAEVAAEWRALAP